MIHGVHVTEIHNKREKSRNIQEKGKHVHLKKLFLQHNLNFQTKNLHRFEDYMFNYKKAFTDFKNNIIFFNKITGRKSMAYLPLPFSKQKV